MNAFVDAPRAVHGVEPICEVLRIAPSTDYRPAARQTDPGRRSARALLDERRCEPIRRVWADNFQVYGADKVWRQLRRAGVAVARCTVERLMRRLGLKGARRGQPVKTTVGDRNTPGPLDRVNRPFTADRPNTLGGPISRMLQPGRASSTSPSSSTDLPGISSAGRGPAPPAPTSCWTRWSRPCTRASLSTGVA